MRVLLTPPYYKTHPPYSQSQIPKPSFTQSPAINNGTTSHRSILIPLRLRRTRSANPISLRRSQPQPERNRSTSRQGSAMHCRRQRSLHWHDGKVLLISTWVQDASRKTSPALPGFLTDSLVLFLKLKLEFVLRWLFEIIIIWWERRMNCCFWYRLGLRRKKWKSRGVWWMKKCRRKWRKCLKNTSLILRLVLI